MKDAYSFHLDQEDLQDYYSRCHRAYERIFERVGLPEVISVASDAGMMGGNLSHEFMLLTPVGEDSIAICRGCDYRANMEAAETIIHNEKDPRTEELALIHTPDIHTIEEVCDFWGSKKERSCKAVVYQRDTDDKYVVLFLRGDMEANETKLTNYLGCGIHPAVITDECELIPGSIGPYQLPDAPVVLFDRSLQGTNNLICGANSNDYHYTGLDIERDVGPVEYHDFSKIREGDLCPHCGRPMITISRGVEVGNIFQLGTKYTESMHMTYAEHEGNGHYPLMGCYGIGIGRLAAAVCEARHDEFGPIWPMSISPWQLHLCTIRSDNTQVKAFADELYELLQRKGQEVLYDDRMVSAGVMFSDADLLGIPIRIVVSPRNLKQNVLEVTSRDHSLSTTVPLESAAEEILRIAADFRK